MLGAMATRRTYELEASREDLLGFIIESFHNVNLESERNMEILHSRDISVKFKGEPAIDCGGPTREFFHVGSQLVFSQDYGMWKLLQDSLTWFTDITYEGVDNYQAMGIFVGLAIFHRVPLPVKFPRIFYKRVKDPNKLPSLSDMDSLDSDVAESMRQTIEMRDEGGDVADIGLNFTITETMGNDADLATTIPLCDGGEEMDVTNENLDEYIRLYMTHRLCNSTRAAFDMFTSGIYAVVPQKLFTIFTEEELSILVSGQDQFDWNQLKAHATYQGYSHKSKNIKRFWKIIDSLTEQQKRDLLYFATSSSRPPIGGLRNQQFVIAAGGRQDDIPTAHTCFNQLVLPEYSSTKVMREKLLIAIANATGFGEI